VAKVTRGAATLGHVAKNYFLKHGSNTNLPRPSGFIRTKGSHVVFDPFRWTKAAQCREHMTAHNERVKKYGPR
jgi:hypothetical protein